MARPDYKPTEKGRQMVKVMIAGGILQAAICGVLGISGKTLRKHFRHEIRAGMAELNGRVIAALYHAAIKGNVTAAIWITRARLGWSETNKLAAPGADGGPATVVYSWADASQPQAIASQT